MRTSVLLILASGVLYANPQQMTVVAGEAQAAAKGSSLEVQVSDRAILNWESFSIQPGEATRFIQPSAGSAVLNRVVGSEMSHLMGLLQANGQVYLVNRNGVVIGKEGRVDTAAFIASALEIRPEEFLAGQDLHLFGDELGSIVNLGTIETSGGPVALLAHRVENNGVIRSDGTVSLVAGHEILLSPNGNTLVFIRPDEVDQEKIEADIQVHGAASLAINLGNEETILVEEGGRLYLRPLSIEIGMESDIQAPKIHVFGDEIDVSGKMSAPKGEIFIGGHFQGKNPTVPNAKQTIVREGSELDVSAGLEGDAGRVIVWSDGTTVFEGKADARGGELGGDGGFVEVSGRDLQFRGLTDRRAPMGKAGTLLLDPINITISTTANSANVAFVAPNYQGTGGTPCAPTPALIQVADLESNLAGGSVVISTNATNWAGCGDAGNIIVSNAISWSSGNTLTLTAAGNLTISDTITSTAGGALVLNVGGALAINAALSINGVSMANSINVTTTGTGSGNYAGITVSANVSTANGNITMTGVGAGAATGLHGISLASGAMSTGSGSITLVGTAPATSTGTSRGIFVNGGTVSTTSGAISLTGTVTLGATGISEGIRIQTGGITSTSGPMTLSGTSSATGFRSYGVMIVTNPWTTNTSGLVTFTNCAGGTQAFSSGIDVEAAFTTSGSITAINSIQSGTGSNAHGVVISGAGAKISSDGQGNINITALSRSTTGLADGIQLGSGTVISTTGAGTIRLIGTGANSDGLSRGIRLDSGSSISSGTGTISVGGIGRGSAGNAGVIFDSTIAIQTSGDINVSGVSSASGVTSHGVSIIGSWTTGSSSSSTVTFGSTITDGTVPVTGCKGGSGASSNGLDVGAAFSTPGHITATNQIIGGSGLGSIGCALAGVALAGTLNSTGGGNIQITASTLATTGQADGINLFSAGAAATISTTGTGTVTLNGTSGISSSTSRGVAFGSDNTLVSSGSGSISITGTARGSAASPGVLFGGTSPVQTTGSITVSGTSSASVAASHGVSITAAWSGGTASSIGFTGTGGATGASHGINLAAAIANSGSVSFNGTAGGGAGSVANAIGANVTTTNAAISFTNPVLLTANIELDSGSGAGNISFSSTISNTSGQTLQITAGTGDVSFGSTVGAATPLTSVTVVSSSTSTVAGNITATGTISLTGTTVIALSGARTLTTTNSLLSLTGPVTIGGTTILTTQASPGSGNITCTGTINGGFDLTINAGSGTVTLGGALGGAARLGAVTLTTSNSLDLGVNITSSSFSRSAAATALTAPVTIDTNGGGGVTFGGTINNGFPLIANAGSGPVTLSGTIGGSVPLSRLEVTASTCAVPTLVRTDGSTQIYTTPVTFSGGATFEDTGSSGISFSSSITGSGALAITATGGPVSVGGAITADGVNIRSTNRSVTVGAITSNDNPITLQPGEGFTTSGGANLPDGILTLRGNINAGAGAVSLSALGRTAMMSIATITNGVSGTDLNITAASLTIGNNANPSYNGELVTVFGSANFTIAGATTMSALVATQNIAISGTGIEIYRNLTGSIYSYVGSLYTNRQTVIGGSGTLSLPTQTFTGPGVAALVAPLPHSASSLATFFYYPTAGYVLTFDTGSLFPPPPPPTPVKEVVVIATTQSTVVPNQVATQTLTSTMTVGSANQDPKTSCTAPSISVTP